MYALFKDGKIVTEPTESQTGAYIDAFNTPECYDIWKGAKLLKKGYEVKEVKPAEEI